MDLKNFFHDNSVANLLRHLGIVTGILFFLSVGYFYIYLPYTTHHGETVQVPALRGKSIGELENFLKTYKLRFEVNDSSYSDSLPRLSVTRQFPFAGSVVKPGRIIYVSLNRVTAPTVPVPDLIDGSVINAQAVLKSNELRLGRVYYVADPFRLVKELQFKHKQVVAGTRLPKGSVIDLIVGDGLGPADYVVGNLVGDEYSIALKKLLAWNLHLGNVEIMPGADTTGTKSFVYKQNPAAGDSVRVGDPVALWLAPKGYIEPDKKDEENP
ncbi:MAG: PASTA domain-containing protein [Bacteroidetes bacterium]|nr:PASTA domain-containing protein [Bacteroidota bacterium]MBS1541526.1 PASTA domain-containing protein [Bacteroidota bacterium]